MLSDNPIDSFFIPNCIAVAQGDLRVPHLKTCCVLIPDNEPRNSQVVSNISRYIDEGYSVVNPEEREDVNDMVMSGHDV